MSSMRIKGAEKDEAKDNQSINQLNINQQILAFTKLSAILTSFQQFQQALAISAFKFLVVAKFLANFQQCYFIHS